MIAQATEFSLYSLLLLSTFTSYYVFFLVQDGSVSIGKNFREIYMFPVYVTGIHSVRQEAPQQIIPR